MSNNLPYQIVEPIISAALREDFGRSGDITTISCVPSDVNAKWVMRSREDGVIAGVDIAAITLKLVDANAVFDAVKHNGDSVKKGEIIANISGNARSLLMAERVMLNFVGRLSGIATLTSKYVELVKHTNAKITDTRKTTPNLRAFEKFAVKMGGGVNHRFGLDDAILIKDNHVAACGGVENALLAAKSNVGHLVSIEIEVDSIAQLKAALPHYPDVIMLDNFSNEMLCDAVKITRDFAGKRITLEASGGVNINTVKAIAETGVDVISVGALTHSAPNFDVGLDSE